MEFLLNRVSACILLLNTNKHKNHKGKVCFIDGTNISTPMRAQVLMSDDNINEIF